MGTVVIRAMRDARSFQTRRVSRVAVVGAGLLGTTLALRFRQAGRVVTAFESAERVDRRGPTTVASRDRALLALLDELDLGSTICWEAARAPGCVRFGELPGGRSQIIERLRERARAIDVDLRLGTRVRSISGDGSGFAIDTGSEIGEFDEVVLAVPSPVAAQLLSSLPEEDVAALRSDASYVGIVRVSFVLKRASGKRYISQVVRRHDRFAIHDPSALLPRADAANVVYVTRPAADGDELNELDDRQLIERFARALPGTAHILNARIVRMPHAFTRKRAAPFTSSIAGLSVVNASHMSGGRHYVERTAALATAAYRKLCAEPIS